MARLNRKLSSRKGEDAVVLRSLLPVAFLGRVIIWYPDIDEVLEDTVEAPLPLEWPISVISLGFPPKL